jgi:hypothetical protein
MPSEVPLSQSPAEPEPVTKPKRPAAKARDNTCQIAGHFAPHVGHALNVLAAEQGKHNQEMLAEALTMLFKRYGKPVVVEGKSRRRPRI